MVTVDEGHKKTNDFSITQATLERRYDLGRSLYLAERFEISPNITELCSLSSCLHIRHGVRDTSGLPLIRKAFVRAYGHVKEWFGYRGDISLALWVAPEVGDLRYMTCLPCDEGFFCAPGIRSGWKIIFFASPQVCRKNADPNTLSGLLAHEITHHIVREISQATDLTMKRKEVWDLPMWLEEGLCQLIQGELDPSFQQRLEKQIAGTAIWYEPDELWNDLSACCDVNRAYVQAYRDTRALVGMIGRQEIIRLLRHNRIWDAYC